MRWPLEPIAQLRRAQRTGQHQWASHRELRLQRRGRAGPQDRQRHDHDLHLGPDRPGTIIADGTVENVFGPVGLAEQVTDSSQTPQFAHADALGSIRLISDSSGSVVGTGDYGAWGTPESDSVTLGGFGFTGEQLDPESGFVYLRARYYDPATSRFLTPDPLGLAGSGVNLYAYVGNNPVRGTDPTGLQDPFEDGLDNLPFGGTAGAGGAAESPGGGGSRAGMPAVPSEPKPFIGPILPESVVGPAATGPVGEGGVCPLDRAGFTRGVDPAGAEPFGPEGEGALHGTAEELAPVRGGSQPSGGVEFDPKQLQEKFAQHGAAFGAQNVSEFKQALIDFLDAPTTQVIRGTYRGTIVVDHYFDPTTRLWVAIDASTGEFITGFRLSQSQVFYLLTKGNVQ